MPAVPEVHRTVVSFLGADIVAAQRALHDRESLRAFLAAALAVAERVVSAG
jgi:hypothetical protein